MNCPNCDGKTEIIKEWDKLTSKNRKRRCVKCGFMFDTYIRSGSADECLKSRCNIRHVCLICGKAFYGSPNKKSCSDDCRKQLLRKSRKIKEYDKIEKTKKPETTINDFIKAQKKAELHGKHLSYAEWQSYN